MNIRKILPDDADAISKIYNYYIENTVVTFETQKISEAEMKRRILEVINSGLPFWGGEVNGNIAGYCYLHEWHIREAYRLTKEVSIYLDKELCNKGLGSMLFKYLLESINQSNVHVLLSGICIPNEGSIRLHEKFGFKQVSCLKEVGWKFGKWRDVGHWQLIL